MDLYPLQYERPQPSAATKAAFFVCVILGLALFFESAAPYDFAPGVLTIPSGSTLSETAALLKGANIIRSETLFKIGVVLRGGSKAVKSGQYLFSSREWTPRVSLRIAKGLEGFPLLKITVPEGSDTKAISSIIKKAAPDFDAEAFKALAKPYEGYLFPDTYFWQSNVAPDKIISDMKSEFDAKIRTASSSLAAFGRPLSDVIKMAAILEREATSSTDRRIVAGILWKRLDSGVALRVDAPFEYFLNKPSSQLTLDDLAKESPYNLYIHTGLGPTPIANPGLEAIMDAMTPTKTAYWYYLSDEHGVLHYAETLDGHAANKNKYIP